MALKIADLYIEVHTDHGREAQGNRNSQIPLGGTVSKIRTTILPDVELEVSDAELTDLTRMGLVLKTNATTPDGARKAAEKQLAANQEEKA